MNEIIIPGCLIVKTSLSPEQVQNLSKTAMTEDEIREALYQLTDEDIEIESEFDLEGAEIMGELN